MHGVGLVQYRYARETMFVCVDRFALRAAPNVQM
jgi:hypothetical protein